MQPYQKQVDDDPYAVKPPNPYQQNPYQQSGAYQPAAYGQPQPAYGQPQYGQPQPAYGQPVYQQPAPFAQTSFQPAAQYGAPVPPSATSYSQDDKFPERPAYRDLLFLVLFVLHLVAVFALLGIGHSLPAPVPVEYNQTYYNNHTNSHTDEWIPSKSTKQVVGICLGAAVFAMFFATVWLSILKKFARQLIYFTLIAAVVFWVASAIIAFAQGAIYAGVFLLLGAAINALFFFFWRSRIPFATAILTTVARIIGTYPAPTYFAYLSILTQLAWVSLWIVTFTYAQRIAEGAGTAANIFLLLSFYWVSQVIKNVIHVTASGLVASWYFMSGSAAGMPRNPTVGSFKRATTTSFGSICLGSLLVAILQLLRQMLRAASRGRQNFLTCIAMCLLQCIDSLVQYFNMYAFTQVAIYGKSYCESAKDTWELIKTSGVSAIVNDNLVSGVLTMGAIVGGIATACVGGVSAFVFLNGFWVEMAVISFIIGVSLVIMTMEVVESGVCTIFVCFALSPQTLQANQPELYGTFVGTYNGLGV